jgi:hypothetical protein
MASNIGQIGGVIKIKVSFKIECPAHIGVLPLGTNKSLDKQQQNEQTAGHVSQHIKSRCRVHWQMTIESLIYLKTMNDSSKRAKVQQKEIKRGDEIFNDKEQQPRKTAGASSCKGFRRNNQLNVFYKKRPAIILFGGG